MESKVDFQWEVNNYLCAQIRFFDQKASLVIAFFAVITPVFVVIALNSELCDILKIVLGGVGLLATLLTIAASLKVYFPRTPRCEEGLIFWENILKHGNESKYAKAVKVTADDKILEGIAGQNFNLSKVLHDKCTWTKRLTIIGLIALAYYIIAMVIILLFSLAGEP